MVTHNLITELGFQRLKDDTYLDALYLTDSVLNPIKLDKVKIVSSAPLFAKAIQRIHNDESISELFTVKGF